MGFEAWVNAQEGDAVTWGWDDAAKVASPAGSIFGDMMLMPSKRARIKSPSSKRLT